MHLQDNFLNKVIEENISVSIYLLNGIKLQGNIHSFDQSVIVLNGQAPSLSTNILFQPLFHPRK